MFFNALHTICTLSLSLTLSHTHTHTHTVNSFVELGKKLLSTLGVKAVFSERLNQDPLESFFGKQRQHGGHRENPTVQDFIYGTQSLRVQGSLAKDPMRGNTRKVQECEKDVVIDSTPLLKRRRCSSSKK